MTLINTVQTIWNGLNWNYLLEMVFGVIPALLCITLHELSHGAVAYSLGDDTAKRQGRLTLNPIRHIDIMGLLMMVFFRFGWAKPVPVNMNRFKNPKKGMAITALAGPVSNVIIAVIFLFLYGFFFPVLNGKSEFAGIVLDMLQITAYMSLGFAVFNILPIPPLDGSKVLFSLLSDELSDEQYRTLMRYERYGMMILLVLVASGLLGRPLSSATQYLLNKLFFLAESGYQLSLRLF